MTTAHDRLVETQFGPKAEAYVTSPVHASGADLDWLETLAAAAPGGRALDLGCGGGHVAYRLAVHMKTVVAYDLSHEMLEAVDRTAASKGLSNIETRAGRAERLPYPDASFDLVASRFSAHHWGELQAGLNEARRVIRPGGRAVFIDGMAPARAAADTHLQTVEVLRDPSHGRDYSAAEWATALGRAGFAVESMRRSRLRMDFAAWTERMGAPPASKAAILALQAGASAEVQQALAIEEDGSFMLDVIWLEATPA